MEWLPEQRVSHKKDFGKEKGGWGWRSRTMNQTSVIKNSNVNAKDAEFDAHLTTKAENYHSYCKAKEKTDSLKKKKPPDSIPCSLEHCWQLPGLIFGTSNCNQKWSKKKKPLKDFQKSEDHLLQISGICQNKSKRQHAKPELFKYPFTCFQPSPMLFSKQKENLKIR